MSIQFINRRLFHTPNRKFLQRIYQISRSNLILILGLSFLISFSELSAKEKVIVGYYDNPPKIFKNSKNAPDGFFADITKVIAKENEWDLIWVYSDWDKLLQDLQESRIDLLVDVAYTNSRNELFVFNREVVLSNWSIFYTHKDSPHLISLHDLEGLEIATLKSSVQGIDLENQIKFLQLNTKIHNAPDFESAMEMVQNKTADAALVNQLVGLTLENKFPDVYANDIVFQPIPLYFAATYDEADLIPLIDKSLKNLKQNPDSAYHIALKKWIEHSRPNFDQRWSKIKPWVSFFAVLSIAGFILFHILLKRRTRELREKIEETERLNRALIDDEIKLKQYQFVIEQIPNMVWMADADGTLSFMNNYGKEFLNFEDFSASQISANWKNFIHQDDFKAFRRIWRKAITKSTNFEMEMRIHCQTDNKWYWHFVTAKPLVGSDDHTTKWVGISTNIDQIKQYQSELIKARNTSDRANQAKSEFLAVVNHELRTPLNAIIGPAQILLSDLKDDESSVEMLVMIENSANQLLKLISDILDLSRIEGGYTVPVVQNFNPSTLCNGLISTFSLMAKEKDLKFYVKCNDLPELIQTDHQILLQIIQNIVANAIKYTPSGSIRVIANWEKKSHSSGALVVYIQDTGPGIPAEYHYRIFDAFQQVDMSLNRSHSGTGLGLAICKRMTQLLNGEISLVKSNEFGTLFKLSIPATIPQIEGEFFNDQNNFSDSLNESNQASLHHVLMVEDDPDNARIFHWMLNRLGYSHDIATTGKEAISLISRNSYSIILMDIQLPDISGIETTKQIFSERNYIQQPYIIAITAHALTEYKDKCNKVGMDDFITKPTSFKDFKEALERGCSAVGALYR